MARRLHDVNRSDLKFTKDELSHVTIPLDFNAQARIIDHANSQLELLGNQGFLKYKLQGFILVVQKIEELKHIRAGSEVDGSNISMARYLTYRTSGAHELINLYKLKSRKRCQLSNFAEENLKANGLQNWHGNGVQLLEHVFNRLRGNSSKLVTFYGHAYGHLDYGQEGRVNFDIANLGTPIQDVFDKFDGFNKGVITYFGPTCSFFGMHCDDVDANAANLNLGGGTKTWIIAHKDYKTRIHELVSQWERQENRKSTRSIKQDFMLDPILYRQHKVPFKVVEQHPGEILFTSRSVFHQGVNLADNDGFVVSVACNVLLKDYILEYEDFCENIILEKGDKDKICPNMEETKEKVKNCAENIRQNSLEQLNHEVNHLDKLPIAKGRKIPQDENAGSPKPGTSRKDGSELEISPFDDEPLKTSDKAKFQLSTVSTQRKHKMSIFKSSTKVKGRPRLCNNASSTSLEMIRKNEVIKFYREENAKLIGELNAKNELITSLQDKIRDYKRKIRSARPERSQVQKCSSARAILNKPKSKLDKNSKTRVQKNASRKLAVYYNEEPDFCFLENNINKCPKCTKCFREKYKLKEHYKNHFQQFKKQNKCKECDREFNFKSALCTHVMREHRGKKENHSCIGCGRLYEWPNKLNDHYMKSEECQAIKLASQSNQDEPDPSENLRNSLSKLGRCPWNTSNFIKQLKTSCKVCLFNILGAENYKDYYKAIIKRKYTKIFRL